MSEEPIDFTGVDSEGAVPPQDDSIIRDFMDMVDFYKSLNAAQLKGLCAEITAFCDAYEGINRGCGCSKKARIQNTEGLYLGIGGALSDENKTALKEAFSANKLRFFHQAGLFLEIE
jgi:hypothetical protein